MIQSVLKHGPEACPVRRVPAAEIEAAVIDQLATCCGRRRSPSQRGVPHGRRSRACPSRWCGTLWRDSIRCGTNSFRPSRPRTVQFLVARVEVDTDRLDIHLRANGLTNIFRQLAGIGAPHRLQQDRASFPPGDEVVSVRVPFSIRKRGGRKLVVLPASPEPVPERPRVDNAMVKAVARAFR